MNKRILLLWGGSTLLIVLGVAVYLGINIYSSKNNNQTSLNKEFDPRYIDAMTADIYGGQTSQETVDLFVEALKANDADLAAKYFMLDDKLSRDKWVRALHILKDKGLLINMASEINLSSINIQLNKYSKVWKIVSI